MTPRIPAGADVPTSGRWPSLIERFWSRVDTEGDCWLWTGSKTTSGYGGITGSRKKWAAHRLAYELLVGPIPEGLTLDHLCRVRHCVNPAHLEPVTMHENMLRGENHAARNARKTHCCRGHEFTPENTRIEPSGRRRCRACQALRVADHRELRAMSRKEKPMPVVCSWCGMQRTEDGSWRTASAEVGDSLVSHGICPECLAEEMATEAELVRYSGVLR